MINRLIAFILFIILLPFIIFFSIIILFEDGFPFFYVQEKYGKNNSKFWMYKFRTMFKETPLKATQDFSDASRYILKSGKIFRKLSIDEVPQLLNIIKGDMNFIGPRPCMVKNEEKLFKMRNEKGINSIKPGITGWAQVNGRDSNSFEEKVILDEYYLKNKNTYLRLKILILTFKVLIFSNEVKH